MAEVKPGYARNYLVRYGKALLMGEGEYRKTLPILHRLDPSAATKITPKMIADEIQQWLNYEPIVRFDQ